MRLESFLPVKEVSDFPLNNIPFGIFSSKGKSKRAGTIIGDHVIDLKYLADKGYFPEDLRNAFSRETLNKFGELGLKVWRETRATIQTLFSKDQKGSLQNIAADELKEISIPVKEVTMHLPVEIGDYTDFYASKEHATNVGTMFRGKENALMPNWVHMPIGYHGRASSVVISGTKITRPNGQIKLDKDQPPVYGKSRKVDFELEMAFVVGQGNDLGTSISVNEAENHILGIVLMNDWSARDIQAWEYQPLGPFLGKNFGTTISPWIVTLDALQPFRVQGPKQDPSPLPYLQDKLLNSFDIHLEVSLKSASSSVFHSICKSNLRYMYWSFAQQLAHHTVNGCNMRPGDLCGTGTISGPTADSFGSLLELSWNGTRPIQLDSESRTFIQDGDFIKMTAFCQGDGYRVGFGDCFGQLV